MLIPPMYLINYFYFYVDLWGKEMLSSITKENKVSGIVYSFTIVLLSY